MTCTVTDCDAPARAKGLCAKHRMRQLRTGDPEKVRRPGRPPSQARAMVKEILGSDFGSPRTFSRYWTAYRLLAELGGQEALQTANAKATRPNGSINVAAFEREALRALLQAVDQEDAATS